MKKILVVIDMQNDFIDGALGTAEAVSIVPKVIEKIRAFDGTVLFTRDTHEEGYLETQEGRNLPVPHCIKGTHGWKLHPEIESLAEDLGGPPALHVFDKGTFGSRALAKYLADDPDVSEIELVGLCTDICVISNALTIKTCLPETPITVDAACCAGVTPESHRRALDAMRVCQIRIVNE